MRIRRPNTRTNGGRNGSTFIIVLWIAVGLVSLGLYFAHSMSFELRAADYRVSGLAAEQAIDGAIRYVSYVLSTYETNGVMPDPSTYLAENVAVGQAHFWLIGRDTNNPAGPSSVSLGLIDEASKLNLNTARSNMLVFLPRMTLDLTQAILDWRDTNGGSGTFQTWYGMQKPSYQNKSAPFESIEELHLLYGGDRDILLGEDLNQNGALDPNETDDNHNGVVDPGLLEFVTVFSREPNTYSNGTPRINIRSLSATGPFRTLLESSLGAGRAERILTQLGFSVGGGGRPGGPGGPPPGGGGPSVLQFTSPLHIFRRSGMTADEFSKVAPALTTVTGSYIEGRVNINTASAAVLGCLPGLSDTPGLAQTLVQYREANPDKISSVAWVADALGSGNDATLTALQAVDCITTQAYQFTADIAALGPNNRGYRRVRVVFDTVDGAPRIVYRQDQTHLGWALGADARKVLLADKQTND